MHSVLSLSGLVVFIGLVATTRDVPAGEGIVARDQPEQKKMERRERELGLSWLCVVRIGLEVDRVHLQRYCFTVVITVIVAVCLLCSATRDVPRLQLLNKLVRLNRSPFVESS